ncbi:MAG: hypothetical protein WC794_00865 [Candidatus Doudnabacteria bacterium]|jgi:hypothetical protein
MDSKFKSRLNSEQAQKFLEEEEQKIKREFNLSNTEKRSSIARPKISERNVDDDIHPKPRKESSVSTDRHTKDTIAESLARNFEKDWLSSINLKEFLEKEYPGMSFPNTTLNYIKARISYNRSKPKNPEQI